MPATAAERNTGLRRILGESIRMTRLSRRLSQEDVAKLAGIGAKQVVNLERSKNVQLATAERVVEALGLSITISEAL